MESLSNLVLRIVDSWVKLCTGQRLTPALDEEEYRRQILAVTSFCWLLTVAGQVIIMPLALDFSSEGVRAASYLLTATSLSVLVSMLALRLFNNRIIALHMLLLVITGAFTVACLYFGGTRSPTYALLLMAPVLAAVAGSVRATTFWSLLVMLVWITFLLLEKVGVEFRQVIAPQNYNVAITLAYLGMGTGVVSLIVTYAEMNRHLRKSLGTTNRELEHLSNHDALTGLLNRRAYEERLERSLERAREQQRCLALIVIDLDHFKDINDNYGHGVGDRVLAEVGERIRQRVRETDLTARLGGDEFAVVLEDVGSHARAQQVADKLAASIAEVFLVRRMELRIAASCGVALFPAEASTRSGLEEQADQAMYRAKKREPVVLASV